MSPELEQRPVALPAAAPEQEAAEQGRAGASGGEARGQPGADEEARGANAQQQ